MVETIKNIGLENIKPSPFNPRKHFDEEKLKEMVASIKEKGIISPILVRSINGKFELVYGERRLKAARMAKLVTIPAIVKNLTDIQVLELQAIENLQRDDLNSLEEARGFKALLDKCKYTQAKLAEKVGKSQGYIAARLALLDLREDFQKDVSEDYFLPGHVKYLMGLTGCTKILDAIRKDIKEKKGQQYTVREFESMIHTVTDRTTKPLGKSSSWKSGPLFNTTSCAKCTFKKMYKPYYGGQEARCYNPSCFNKKQAAARKVENERIKSKVEKGQIVPEENLKGVKELGSYECHFDKKTCSRCDKRKVALVKERYGNKKVKKEVCTDPDCFNKKNREHQEAQEKKKETEFKKQVEKIKAKAARAKIDRNFWILLVAENIHGGYGFNLGEKDEAVIMAYNLDKKKLQTRKAALEYFTSNKKLDLEEIFRFITYWDED